MDPIMVFMKKEQKDKLDRYRILNETARKGQILFTGSAGISVQCHGTALPR